MNCKDVQELLPLHVGGDLAAKQAHSLSAHLENCDACSDLAIGYRESFLLTKNVETPAFSSEFYDGIRQSVLSQIAQDSVKSRSWSFADLLPRTFRLRPEWAVAALLIVAAFAFYFISNRDKGPVETVQTPAWNNPKPVVPSSPSNVGDPAVTPQEQPRTANNGTTRRKPRQRNVARSVKEPTYTAPPVNSPEESVAASQPVPKSAEPLRVEMQTNDSNIRIIWFTNQNAKQDSPGKGF